MNMKFEIALQMRNTVNKG